MSIQRESDGRFEKHQCTFNHNKTSVESGDNTTTSSIYQRFERSSLLGSLVENPPARPAPGGTITCNFGGGPGGHKIYRNDYARNRISI